MAISMVEIRGHYEDAHRTLRTGSVTLTPSFPISNGTTLITQVPVTADLVNGNLSVTVAADDDTGTTPTGMVYQVTETLDVPDGRPLVTTYNIAVTAADAAAGIDLATATRVQTALPQFAAYLTQPAADARYTRVVAGVVNVQDYGAVADGTATAPHDNAPAFQNAINAVGQGGVVIVPPGHYRLASTIVLSLGVTLRGAGWNPHFTPRTNMTTSFLRPSIGADFVGTELIRIDPAPVNGSYLDSAYGGGPRIEGLALSGRSTNNASAAAITGIAIADSVHDAGITDVTCWKFTSDGVKVTNASGIEITRVVSTTNGGNGFNFVTGATDANLVDCYSQGNAGDGYVLPNPNAVSLHNCRSEFNAGYGYKIIGLNYASRLIGCNTDRSGKDGFYLNTLDGGHPLLLVGCEAKRDGSDGLSRAGFNLIGTDATTQCAGAVLTACSTYVGRNDDGTGTRSPAYGVQTQFTRRATIDAGGWIEGTSGPYNDLAACLTRYSGTVQVTTDPTTGVQTVSSSDRTTIVGATGSGRSLFYNTRGSGNRWELVTNSTTEAGANAGSDFDISRYTDAGALLEAGTFRITRSSGAARFLRTLAIGASADGTTAAATFTTAADGTATTPTVLITPSSAAKRALDIRLTADTVSRFRVDESAAGSGTITLGDGTSADVNLYRSAANTLATDDDLALNTVGKGLKVKEGTNAKMGTLTLTGATPVVVPTTAVTATSRIYLTTNAPGGTPGFCWVSARTAGTSFTVTGTAADTSTVAWLIVEPA